MVAYTTRMPAGIAGNTNRQQASTVERQVMSATAPATTYGVFMAMDAPTGTVRLPTAGDTAATIYGLLVRPYPTQSSTDGLNVSTPMTNAQGGEANILKRGYMTVRLMSGTAVKGGAVGVGLPGDADTPIGGISALPVGATIAPLGSPMTTYFTGPADATGMTEIAFNL